MKRYVVINDEEENLERLLNYFVKELRRTPEDNKYQRGVQYALLSMCEQFNSQLKQMCLNHWEDDIIEDLAETLDERWNSSSKKKEGACDASLR